MHMHIHIYAYTCIYIITCINVYSCVHTCTHTCNALWYRYIYVHALHAESLHQENHQNIVCMHVICSHMNKTHIYVFDIMTIAHTVIQMHLRYRHTHLAMFHEIWNRNRYEIESVWYMKCICICMMWYIVIHILLCFMYTRCTHECICEFACMSVDRHVCICRHLYTYLFVDTIK